jgi:hypothetical protein
VKPMLWQHLESVDADDGDVLAPAPLFGALNLGEVANDQGEGYPRFHNATLVEMPWS